ncbi:SusE domain-containing protein [Pontimicrobium sp. IMCC45349]|uniref:SusE domain-containing protein n=1 Tax=Pontimicrobium sp. IMCC45349 TaxID=3391574 RepID=UPI0039A09E93
MKKILKLISFFTLLIFVVNCNDTEDFEFTTPVDNFSIITPNDGASIILDGTNGQNNALTLVWNDNVTGAESYSIDMSMDDTFSNIINIGSSSTNTFTMSVETFNAILLDNNISALEEASIYLRITGNEMQSNAIRLTVSSYPEESPIITSPDSTFEVVLSDITEDDIALTVDWDDPNFAPESSVLINYYVEAAVAGSDFTTVESLGNTQERTLASTHAELNDVALNLGLEAETVGSLDIRVRSVLETTSGELERISNFITISVTPYETALPPALYGVGAGLPDAGWGWDSPEVLPLLGSKYSANVNLSPDNGGNFRFFLQEDWGPDSYNYPWFETRGFTIDANLVNANDGDSNFQFIGTAGEYFLEIDMENKTITLGAPQGANCEFDQLWLVGAGVPDAGWGWGSPVQLPCTGTGIYSGNVNLQNNGGADNNFRFFSIEGDWNSGLNFPYYIGEGYAIDSNFVDAMDGDNNFAFVGTSGNYFLTIDTVNKTITLGPPQTNCEYDQLWLVGAGVPDAGWGWGSPVQLPCTGAGVYSGSVTLANDAFRFFTIEGDWNSGLNFPYYTGEGYTIDANFTDAMDGDNNFSFIGTPGTYTLTLDTVNKTITLN